MSEELRWYQPAYWIRGAIRAYQHIVSRRTGSNCRYLPTCSAYAVEALETHGAFRGSWLGFRRVLSCNPLSTRGFAHQPVPPRRETIDA